MDLLDSYAYIGTPQRHDKQDNRANVMTVERANSNKDHEIPIYNRPERPTNLRLTPRISDDQQIQATEDLLLTDALKLMLSPYTKSAPLKHDDVNEMTSKLLSTVVTEEEDKSAMGDQSNTRNDDIIVKEEPSE